MSNGSSAQREPQSCHSALQGSASTSGWQGTGRQVSTGYWNGAAGLTGSQPGEQEARQTARERPEPVPPGRPALNEEAELLSWALHSQQGAPTEQRPHDPRPGPAATRESQVPGGARRAAWAVGLRLGSPIRSVLEIDTTTHILESPLAASAGVRSSHTFAQIIQYKPGVSQLSQRLASPPSLVVFRGRAENQRKDPSRLGGRGQSCRRLGSARAGMGGVRETW